ncbi:MAG: FprA family A-type flavoprotein [Candidatus Bathyarchaeota archaeon]|nr:MAG: FprA family A-type flavoprotein [Candidatus Bathyarchaeota archaeon]
MWKVVIIYDSVTGNNELMAKAVAEGVESINHVEAQLYKIGDRFPISILNDAFAIIVGSPSIYGNMTLKLSQFFDNLNYLSEMKKIRIEGKKGAAFGSYAWDGGWHTERIEQELMKLGLEMVAPPLSVADQEGKRSRKISRDDVDRCRELGKTVARVVTGNQK